MQAGILETMRSGVAGVAAAFGEVVPVAGEGFGPGAFAALAVLAALLFHRLVRV